MITKEVRRTIGYANFIDGICAEFHMDKNACTFHYMPTIGVICLTPLVDESLREIMFTNTGSSVNMYIPKCPEVPIGGDVV